MHIMQAIYESLKAEFPAEYVSFDCAAIALSQLLPTLRAAVATWDPLAAPLLWLPVFSAWKPLLATGAAAPTADYALEDSEEADGGETDPFAALVTHTLQPPLQRAVMSAWHPHAPGALLTFFDHWAPVLPEGVTGRLLRGLVLPRLRAAAAEWDGRRGAPPPHAWLHPWLPHLSAELQDTYPALRTKLAGWLQTWKPWEEHALAALAPWKPLWSRREWEALTDRVVVPPLEAAFLELLSLNPLQPDHRPLEWLSPWGPLLSGGQLAGVFDRAFFPKLHEVVHMWITHSGVIFSEVWAWLEAAKRTHVPVAAMDDPRTARHLSAAFTAINNAQNGVPLPAGYPAVAAAPAAAAGGAGGRSAAALAQAERDVERRSVKEFVAEAAAAAGLAWVPRPGRVVGGQQVYAMGKLSVVVDIHAGVVKAFLGDRWVPMGIDEAVQHALKKG